MALTVKDRVKESTTVTGTGAITLGGSPVGFQAFSTIGNGNSTYYSIYSSSLNEWEVGVGTYAATTNSISRDTVLSSSNNGLPVNFSAGIKEVICTLPASVFVSTQTSFSTELATATAGQTVFVLTSLVYSPGANSLAVYVNGLCMVGGVDYVETAFNTVTFTSGLALADQVLFIGGRTVNDAIGAEAVSYIPAGTGAVATSVRNKLREAVSVKDFGAIGDGVTDDRTAFSNALAAANGAVVKVPSGTFNLGSALILGASDKLLFDPGARTSGAALSGGLRILETARSTATAGSKMKIDALREQSSFKLEDEAGIWAAETYSFAGFNKEFTASTLPASGASPASTLFAFANSNGSNSDVVAIMGDAVARANNGVVFGGNLIARNDAGVNGAKLVGLEIDLEPAAGTSISSASIGLVLNVFNIPTSAPAIQIGGLGGGTFANGLIVNAVTGSGLAAQTGSSAMNSLVDASQGTYNNDAIVLGNSQKLRLMGTGGTHAKIYNDSTNAVRLVLGSGSLAIRNSADTTSLVSIDPAGAITAGTYKVGANQVVASRITGWTAPTGTTTKGGFDTATVTLAQLAQNVKALIDSLTAHGLIGT